jgi:hypothetical protein
MEMNPKRVVITDLALSKNPRIPVPHNYIKYTKIIFSFLQFFIPPSPSLLVPIPPLTFSVKSVYIYIK